MLKSLIFDKIGGIGAKIYRRSLCQKKQGWRSDISKKMIFNFAKKCALKLIMQTDSWGEKQEYNCKLFNDQITILKKWSK